LNIIDAQTQKIPKSHKVIEFYQGY